MQVGVRRGVLTVVASEACRRAGTLLGHVVARYVDRVDALGNRDLVARARVARLTGPTISRIVQFVVVVRSVAETRA